MSDLDELYAKNKERDLLSRRIKFVSFGVAAIVIIGSVCIYWLLPHGHIVHNFGEKFGGFVIISAFMMSFVFNSFFQNLLRKKKQNLGAHSNFTTDGKVINQQHLIKLDKLNSLEIQRTNLISHIKKAKIISFLVGVGILAGAVIYFSHMFAIFAGIVAGRGSYALLTSTKIRKFKSNFKSQVIAVIVNSRGLKYDAQDSLGLDEFFKLYDCTVDGYHGEDLISGKIHGVNIRFSDFYAYKCVNTKNGTKRVTQFLGLLFIADFPKSINATVQITCIKSKNLSKYGERANMDNLRFEEFFDVFTTDQIMARYALTPSLMERILKLYLQLDAPINILISSSKIYISIENWRNNFEPDIYQNIGTNEAIVRYVSEVDGFTDIVNELNLNDKIWHLKPVIT